MALSLVITNAGRAALIAAANDGTNAVTVAQVGVSGTAIAASPTTTVLTSEVKRISTIAGGVVADDTIHMMVRDTSADVYSVRSIALYLANGTLFASYGQADIIVGKAAAATLLLAIDIQLQDIDAETIEFGDTDFLNPPATTDTAGVVELATNAEALAKTDATRAVTPANLAAVTAALAKVAGQIFSGLIGRDTYFNLDIVTGNAVLSFDNGDSLRYVRASNRFEFVIGGTPAAWVTSAGIVVGDVRSIKRNDNGAYIHHLDPAWNGDTISGSGSAPTPGGNTGDFHLQDLGNGTFRFWFRNLTQWISCGP